MRQEREPPRPEADRGRGEANQHAGSGQSREDKCTRLLQLREPSGPTKFVFGSGGEREPLSDTKSAPSEDLVFAHQWFDANGEPTGAMRVVRADRVAYNIRAISVCLRGHALSMATTIFTARGSSLRACSVCCMDAVFYADGGAR